MADIHHELHETARGWYLAKIANGEVPQVVTGGLLDGLSYFVVTLNDPMNDQSYWLTDVGLFEPKE